MDTAPKIFADLVSDQQELILKHLSLLLETNESLNMTRIASTDEAMLLHIEDSLAALPAITAAPNGLYGDLGSGNGYPGIPLAIVSGRQTVLVESIKKKAAALEQFVFSLGLSSRIEVAGERIEELAERERGQFSVLTARALTSLPSLMELASPLLAQNGQLICFKSKLADDELQTAKKIEQKMGLQLISDTRYCLSDKRTERRLLIYSKSGESEVKLPRRAGMAQKRPYTH